MKIKQTAIHEAGHVVVDVVSGLTVYDVALTHDTVDETGVYGCAHSPNPAFGYYHDSVRERRAAVRKAAVGCLAGLAAEHVFFRVPLDLNNENAGHDVRIVLGLAHDGELRLPKSVDYVGDEATWAYIRKRLLREAVGLVRVHRADVQRIADALLEAGRLTGEQIEALLAPKAP